MRNNSSQLCYPPGKEPKYPWIPSDETNPPWWEEKKEDKRTKDINNLTDEVRELNKLLEQLLKKLLKKNKRTPKKNRNKKE